MKNKYVFTAVLLAVILFVGNMLTMAYVRTEQSREQLKEGNLLVVTSFYPMYVAAENVIGDVEGVTLENLFRPAMELSYYRRQKERKMSIRMKRNQKNTCMRRKQQIRRRKVMFMTKRPIMQITIILSIHMGMKMLMHG